jgi:Aerotolerance regulator N-terminal
MSFLAPWALAFGVAAAVAAVALHLLSTRRPPRALLPTARFVPESEARAVSRSSRPTDLLLLAARVAAALLIGAAFARPVPDAPGPSTRTVVLLDVSASVEDAAGAARAALAAVDEGGAIVVFDTSARALDAAYIDRLTAWAVTGDSSRDAAPFAIAPRPAPGILSAALVAGVREARAVARGADSVRLVLVTPLAEEAFDAATAGARAAWPGGITLVRVRGVSDSVRGVAPVLDTPLADDPFAPAVARLSARGTHAVRIVRREPNAADSAWAREGDRVLVHWPVAASAPSEADGVQAFGLHRATLVAPLARLGAAASVSSGGSAGANGGADAGVRVVARWRDGARAAVESRLGAGCVRDVQVGIPLAGDLTLRPPFVAFLGAMVEPCGGARGAAVSDSVAQAFAGGEAAASARLLAAAGTTDSTLAAWLLAAALLALGAEWLLRRRRGA